MILPAQMIRAREGMITPFEERSTFCGMSYGLSAAGYDVRLDQDIYLPEGYFKLASTIEHFNMPNDLLGVVHDKSSWVRQGLMVHNTVIEPGWSGHLTLELRAHDNVQLHDAAGGRRGLTQTAFVLKRGTPIAQIVFHLLAAPTERPYSGKYQNQERGPQRARDEGDADD